MSDSESSTPSLQVNDTILLEPLKTVHANSLYLLIESDRPNLTRYLYWVQAIQSVEDTRQHYIEARINRTTYGSFWFLLSLEGQAAGVIGVKSIDNQSQRAELGYWMHTRYSGRGVMTQSVEKTIGWLKCSCDVKEIEIQCYRENIPSSKLAQRIGARQHQVIKSYAGINPTHKDLLVFRKTL